MLKLVTTVIFFQPPIHRKIAGITPMVSYLGNFLLSAFIYESDIILSNNKNQFQN